MFLLFQNPINSIEKSYSYHSKMADKYYHDGDFPNMIYHLQQKVKLDPKDVNSYSDLAYYYWSMSVDDKLRRKEFMDKAFYYLKTGLENNKDSAYMYDEFGNFYITSSKNYKLAISYLEQSISKSDSPLSSFHSLFVCYLKTEQYTKAKEVMIKCLKKFPDDLKGKANLEKINKLLSSS